MLRFPPHRQPAKALAVILTKMRKTFTLIFSIVCNALIGQNLKFDVMAKYSTTHNYKTSESTSYAISSDDNYMMRIKNQHDGKVAEVCDLKSLKIHSYTLIESKSNHDEIKYSFKYLYTKSFIRTPINISAKNFEFESISTSGDYEKVKVSLYKNKSKTKTFGTLELTILKSKINLFPLFRFTCLHTTENLTDFNYAKGGVVTNCKSINNSIEYNLLAFAEVNLELKLPD